MMMKINIVLLVVILFIGADAAFAQKHEIGFISGGLRVGEKEIALPSPGLVRFGTGFTYQVSYSQRFLDGRVAALYFELPLTGTPRTSVKTSNVLSPRSYSSLFITPGIKLKLLPAGKYSPYAAIGAGYARFNESSTRIDNQPNEGERGTNRGVFDYGFGLDAKVFPYVSLRGELRYLVTGTPKLNADLLEERRYNTFIAGGIVVRF